MYRYIYRTIYIAILAAVGGGFAAAQQKINPATQISWPAGCQVYNVAQAACPAIGVVTFTGAWNGGRTYIVNEAVYFAGTNSTYVSLQNSNTNNSPATSPSFWTILVAGGGTGGSTTAASVGAALSGTVGGTANAITIVLTTPTPSIPPQTIVQWKPIASNTSNNVTLTVSPLGALPLVDCGSTTQLASGSDVVANVGAQAMLNVGGYWQLMNPQASGCNRSTQFDRITTGTNTNAHGTVSGSARFNPDATSGPFGPIIEANALGDDTSQVLLAHGVPNVGDVPTATGSNDAAWLPQSGSIATNRNPTACDVSIGNQICPSDSTYNVSPNGNVTTTVTATWAPGTSGSIGSCSTFQPGNGVAIFGAGAASAKYIGTVVSCNGTTLNVTPATMTSVASGATGCNTLGAGTAGCVLHDESVAFQAIINLNPTDSKTGWLNDGYYRLNGPLQDTGGANGILVMPHNVIANSTITKFAGFTPPTTTTASGAIIETDSNSGAIFSGFCSTCGQDNFTFSGLEFDNVTIRVPDNPSITAVNGFWIATLNPDILQVDTGTTGISNLPTTGTGKGVVFPASGNNVRLASYRLFVSGFATCIQTNEHTTILEAGTANCIKAYVPESRPGTPYAGNVQHIVQAWDQQSTYVLAAGANISTIHFDTLNMETTGSNGVYDPTNLIYGDVNFNVQAAAGAVTPTNPAVNGAANVCIRNIQFPNAATFGGACPTASSGAAYGSAAYYSLSSLKDSWQSQEGVGGTLLNSGNPANPLTATSVTWTPVAGFQGLTATYDGTASTSSGAVNDTYTGSTPFSACAWIDPTTLSPAVESIIGTIAVSSPFTGWRMDLYNTGGSGAINVYLINSITGNTYLEARTPYSVIAINTVSHVCFTADGTQTAAGLRIYVNGVSQTLSVGSDTLSGSIVSGLPINVGATQAGTAQYFSGAIVRPLDYARALSASEVLEMYNLGPLGYTSNASTLRGTITFTAATTDAATITGVTSSSVCAFSPTNSTASAASTVLAYVSGVSSNTVTFTHAGTVASGATENILCTVN